MRRTSRVRCRLLACCMAAGTDAARVARCGRHVLQWCDSLPCVVSLRCVLCSLPAHTIPLLSADHVTYKNNKAVSDYMYSDKYVDVGARPAFQTLHRCLLALTHAPALHGAESNDVDYRLEMFYANWGTYWYEHSDYNAAFDIGAPVTGVCASFSANATASTSSLPAVPCGPITVPPGAILSAGTTKVPGGVCTGDTVMKLLNASDSSDLVAYGNHGNAVANDGARQGIASSPALGLRGARQRSYACALDVASRRLWGDCHLLAGAVRQRRVDPGFRQDRGQLLRGHQQQQPGERLHRHRRLRRARLQDLYREEQQSGLCLHGCAGPLRRQPRPVRRKAHAAWLIDELQAPRRTAHAPHGPRTARAARLTPSGPRRSCRWPNGPRLTLGCADCSRPRRLHRRC